MLENNITRLLLLTGGFLILAALVYHFFGDKLGWIGNLPGDIRIDKGNTKIFFPITTMILFSIVLSVLMNFIKRFF